MTYGPQIAIAALITGGVIVGWLIRSVSVWNARAEVSAMRRVIKLIFAAGFAQHNEFVETTRAHLSAIGKKGSAARKLIEQADRLKIKATAEKLANSPPSPMRPRHEVVADVRKKAV